MSEPQAFLRDGKTMWAETEALVRKDYGEERFQTFLKYFEVNDHTGNPDEVVDAMLDAICAAEPQLTYRVCGWKYSLIWFLNDYLPTSLFDTMSKILRK